MLNVCPGCLIDPLRRDVDGYLVRQPSKNGELELYPDDDDEATYVLVALNRSRSSALIMGWINGSEGKTQQFQKNDGLWLIPHEALHSAHELKRRAA